MYFNIDEDGNVRESKNALGLENFWVYPSRLVCFTKINHKCYLSTVFLGIDHNYSFYGPPIIYESMLFGYEKEIMLRYSTREEALEGHLRILLSLNVQERDIFSLNAFNKNGFGSARFHIKALKHFKQLMEDKKFLESVETLNQNDF